MGAKALLDARRVRRVASLVVREVFIMVGKIFKECVGVAVGRCHLPEKLKIV